MPNYSSPTPSATSSVPASLPNQAEASTHSMPSNAVLGSVMIAVAFSVTLLALGYRRYRTCQRSRLLKRQIAMLEAMWRISSTK
ncbi:MAG: hypothetical protein KME27_26000 [Lyngbya sp. HA4199-MV5]|jgi:hypothetical protein|nr:hypothetical protein [Lyngbya sp. HA4199-MV5]